MAIQKPTPAELSILAPANPQAWWDWLAAQHKVSPGVWLRLNKKASGAAFFATLDATNRYALLHRVQTAKKPETRARRIGDYVAMLARRVKLHP